MAVKIKNLRNTEVIFGPTCNSKGEIALEGFTLAVGQERELSSEESAAYLTAVVKNSPDFQISEDGTLDEGATLLKNLKKK